MLKGWNTMETEIGKVGSQSAGQSGSGPNTTVTAAAQEQVKVAKVQVAMPERPKIDAPKPVDIKYDPKLARANLSSAINMLNEQMASTKRGLGFSYDQSKNSAVIKVTDLHSGNVVRQIPTEDVLKMAHHIDAMKGILYNKIA
jgi:flagellar protein FlaG